MPPIHSVPHMRASSLPASRQAFGPATCLVLVLALALSGGVALSSESSRLEVIGEDGRLLAFMAMPEGRRWCLGWNHSVAGFPVLDCYRHLEGRMVLERSHLPDFAAGLGHIPGRGRQVSDGEGGYWIEAIDEPVPGNAYRLRVGSLRVDHRLVTDDRDIRLSELAANQGVTIRLSAPSSP